MLGATIFSIEMWLAMAAAAFVTGAASAVVCLRLWRDKQRLVTALNNMTQGLCMFDARARLTLWNTRYLEMYGMSPEVVTVGRPLREILQHRIATGSFSGDPDSYIAELRAELPVNLRRFLRGKELRQALDEPADRLTAHPVGAAEV